MKKVLTIGPNGGQRVYSSTAATSRVLSGWGEDDKRTTVARRCNEGGGKVGNVWVQYAK